eukprot:gene2863-biopygen3471
MWQTNAVSVTCATDRAANSVRKRKYNSPSRPGSSPAYFRRKTLYETVAIWGSAVILLNADRADGDMMWGAIQCHYGILAVVLLEGVLATDLPSLMVAAGEEHCGGIHQAQGTQDKHNFAPVVAAIDEIAVEDVLVMVTWLPSEAQCFPQVG